MGMYHHTQRQPRAWWVLIIGTLGVVVTFLALEVYDLDGSALAHRLVQTPMASPSSNVDPEALLRLASASPSLPVFVTAFAFLSVFHLAIAPRYGIAFRNRRIISQHHRHPRVAFLSSEGDTLPVPPRS